MSTDFDIYNIGDDAISIAALRADRITMTNAHSMIPQVTSKGNEKYEFVRRASRVKLCGRVTTSDVVNKFNRGCLEFNWSTRLRNVETTQRKIFLKFACIESFIKIIRNSNSKYHSCDV